MGIDVNDMEYVFRETDYVTGVHQVHGGSGDPSPFTAYGTLQGLMAALQFKHGNEDVGKYSYAVQGCGHVGGEFIKLLREQGAKVFVTDINKDAVQRCVDELGCEAVGLDEIYDVDADVYSPCALGGTVNEQTIDRIKAQDHLRRGQQPAGHRRDRRRAAERGVLYAPDYAVNAGGVMNMSLEIDGYNRERAMRMMRTIYYNLAASSRSPRPRTSRPTWRPTVWPRSASRDRQDQAAAHGQRRHPFPGPHARSVSTPGAAPKMPAP